MVKRFLTALMCLALVAGASSPTLSHAATPLELAQGPETVAVGMDAATLERVAPIAVVEIPMMSGGKVAKIEEQGKGVLRLTLTSGKLLITPDRPTIRQLPLSQIAPSGPMNEVPGNCGVSYVYLSRLDRRVYLMDTGFRVHSPAIDYEWHVTVTGPWYLRIIDYGGG